MLTCFHFLSRHDAAPTAPKQFNELLDGEAGVGDDATQRAGSEPFVIGHDGPCIGFVATKHHVAAGLAAKNEPSALQGSADFTAG
jgi:hypothetical protein